MSAVSIALAWAALAVVAFLALSASALAQTRHDLEVDPRATSEPEHRSAGGGEALLLPGGRTLWARPGAGGHLRRQGVAHMKRRGALADVSW